MFWMRFKAYASVKGFLPAIQVGGEQELPQSEGTPLDPNDPADEPAIEAKKQNALAVASFTMAFTTHSLMMLVHQACNAKMAWRISSPHCH